MESPRLRRARPDEAAVITRLALRSKQRWGYSDGVRSGHGRRHFERAADVARDWGYRILEFDSDPHAETFYLHLGAERIGMKASTLIAGREFPVMR